MSVTHQINSNHKIMLLMSFLLVILLHGRRRQWFRSSHNLLLLLLLLLSLWWGSFYGTFLRWWRLLDWCSCPSFRSTLLVNVTAPVRRLISCLLSIEKKKINYEKLFKYKIKINKANCKVSHHSKKLLNQKNR